MNLTENKWLRIATTSLVALLGLYVLTLTLITWKEGRGSQVDGVPSIQVTGTGEVFAVPDTASFTFTVSEEDKVVKAAQDRATEKSNSAIDFLKSKGVEERHIKTVGYNMYPKYEPVLPRPCTQFSCPEPEQVISGYEVSQTIEVKVEDTNLAGELLTGLGAVGVTNLSGISFTVEDEDALMREARKQAIEEAEVKAEELARDLGVRIVRVRSFSEQWGGYPVYSRALMADAKGGAEMANPVPDLPVGENKVSSTVVVVYEIR